MTGNVDPEAVRRIGLSLVGQLDAQPPRAFDTDPVARVGAILNVSAAVTREEVLSGLEQEDAAFAEEVRRKIFTYAHIPTRLSPRDVPKLLRVVDPSMLVTALTFGGAEVSDFLLTNISQRMAQSLREEMAERRRRAARESIATRQTAVEIGSVEAAAEAAPKPRSRSRSAKPKADAEPIAAEVVAEVAEAPVAEPVAEAPAKPKATRLAESA